MPALAAFLIIAATGGADLSDLDPQPQPADAPALLNWSDLYRERRHALKAGLRIWTGVTVQVIGYMVEGNRPVRAGAPAPSFVLLPEAGNLLHPAHTFGDQMVKVSLAAGSEMQFSPKALVLACGTLRILSGDPVGTEPLYVLEESQARIIDKTEIAKYFK